MEAEKAYVKLNVEKYGGMICAPWLDRPLSVAGQLIVRQGDRFVTKLVDVDRDFCDDSQSGHSHEPHRQRRL